MVSGHPPGRTRGNRVRSKAPAVLSILLALSGFAGTSVDPSLVSAAKNQDVATVRALLKQGADVNATQADGTSALHWAARWDDHDTADVLIRAGARIDAANELGATPLWVSCTYASLGVIERLLKAGANPNIRLPGGETPLMTVARSGNAQAVRMLLAHGASVNARERARGQTALMWAVAQQHPDVAQLLIDHGADVHARSLTRGVVVNHGVDGGDADFDPTEVVDEERGGFTPLLFAARLGDIVAARILLAAKTNVNDVAAGGTSALVIATHSGHSAMATFLLENGADPNAAGAGYAALHIALVRRDRALVKTLLMHGADPNLRVRNATPARRLGRDVSIPPWVGATAFWVAAKLGDVDFMRDLVSAGADPRVALSDGTTAVMAPMGGGSRRRDVRLPEPRTLEVVKTAIELGGEVSASDEAGDTALHLAAARRLDTIVQFLVASGANLHARNKQGQTPLASALAGVERRRLDDGTPPQQDTGPRTAELLRSLGARE